MSPLYDCFGDAFAVNMLLQALLSQPQLEAVEFRLASFEGEATEESDSEDEPECSEEDADLDDKAEVHYRPAWLSIKKLLEQSTCKNLR